MKTLKYTLWITGIVTMMSCEKFDFENCKEEIETVEEVEEVELEIY